MPRNNEVDEWFETYENPMKEVVQRVREIILAADERVDECIKWKSPTFTFQGNLASFNPRSKQHASLMFHTGASIPGEYPRLEGSGDTARYMKLTDLADAEAARPELEAIVKAWCEWKAAGVKGKKPASPAKQSSARKPASPARSRGKTRAG